jgi:regulatory protein
MPKQLSPEKALDRAQWLCSRQEKCIADIRIKLSQWGIDSTQSNSIINSLLKDKFIDESRYAQTFAREKARFNKWGPRKIGMALRVKKIHDDIIEHTLEEINHLFSSDSLSELIEKKAKSIKYKDSYDLKTKLVRFGISRGFNYEEIKRVVNELIGNIEN